MQIHKPYYEKQIFVCVNEREPPKECCMAKQSEEIHRKLKDAVISSGLREKVRVSKSLCQDLCSFGPVVSIYPDNVTYKNVSLDDVDEIVKMHVLVMKASN